MKENNLNNTKKKLTIIFTLLIFGIVILLELVFFSSKYYGYINTEEKSFNIITKSISKEFISLNDFVINFELHNRFFRLRDKGINKPEQRPKMPNERFINLLIINKDKNELVFSNIVDRLDTLFIEKELLKDDYNKIEQEDGYLVKKILISEADTDYDILFIKKLRYGFVDYLQDLFGFIFVTLLFSILFYYIGLRFVGKNLEPVEQNLKDMQDFIHNAGHELKTPIAIINSNLQLLNEIKKYDKELTQESITEIKRLDKLIEGLVELSDINTIQKKEKLDLKEEIDLIINDYKKKLEKKDIKLEFDVKDNFILKSSKEYFYILFSNLLANSIKYTKKGGNIQIYLNKNSLILKDNGIGISDDNLEKIWNRFFQVDKSRNSNGFGIGLSLVKKISEIYKWKINVKSKEGEGTSFKIVF